MGPPEKFCSGCKATKPEEMFSFRNKAKGLRHTRCKDCVAQVRKRHYRENKEYYFEKARRHDATRTEENQRLMCEYLSDKKCADCPENNLVVLQFDHLRDKKYNIAHLMHRAPWKTVLKEIEKCEIVCANCHAIRTQTRSQSYRIKWVGVAEQRRPLAVNQAH